MPGECQHHWLCCAISQGLVFVEGKASQLLSVERTVVEASNWFAGMLCPAGSK